VFGTGIYLQLNQVVSSQVKLCQVKLSQVKSSQVKSSQVKSSQVKSSQVKSSRVETSRVESSRVELSRVESSRVESSCLNLIESFFRHFWLSTELLNGFLECKSFSFCTTFTFTCSTIIQRLQNQHFSKWFNRLLTIIYEKFYCEQKRPLMHKLPHKKLIFVIINQMAILQNFFSVQFTRLRNKLARLSSANQTFLSEGWHSHHPKL